MRFFRNRAVKKWPENLCYFHLNIFWVEWWTYWFCSVVLFFFLLLFFCPSSPLGAVKVLQFSTLWVILRVANSIPINIKKIPSCFYSTICRGFVLNIYLIFYKPISPSMGGGGGYNNINIFCFFRIRRSYALNVNFSAVSKTVPATR